MTGREQLMRGLEHEVGVMLRRVRRVISERARSVHEDLAPVGYLMLVHLAEAGPVRATVLVEAFDLDKGAVSRHVQHLVELGLAGKEPDPEDGRAWLVTATPEGRRRLEAVATRRRERWDAQLAQWSEPELATFVQAMGRYNEALSG